MEIFQIDENLYQSSLIDDVERVKQFDICIDLAGTIDLGAGDFTVYLKWTIEDKQLPDTGVLKAVAAFGYEMAYKKNLKVLVHCDMGVNRSSLVNGVILRMNGLKGQEIVERIRSRRPGALTNPYFEEYLIN